MRVATDTEQYATKQELRELVDRVERFEADQAEVDDTVVKTLGQLVALVRGLDGKVDGLDRKVDGLGRKVDRLDRRVDGLERKVDAICGHFGIRVQD